MRRVEVHWVLLPPEADTPGWGLSPYYRMRNIELFEQGEFLKEVAIKIPKVPRPYVSF